MNKNKIFYSYKNELNFLATHIDISKFNLYHFTILDYIKNDLGPKYKFRNYKITGPNYSKIEFNIKKIKNKNKTDYIKSKTTITFTISSIDKNQIDYISKRIKKSYPHIMHSLNSFDLVNYISLINYRINIACNNMIFILKIGNEICEDVNYKMKLIQETMVKIDPSYVNTKSISAQYLKDLKEIIDLSADLELIFIKKTKLKDNYPLIHEEIIKLLNNMKAVNPKDILTQSTHSHQLIELSPNNKFEEKNYVNKIVVYVNLLIILLIFILAYLRAISKK